MFIKLNFFEEVVIVPQCWGGLIVSAHKIEIVDSLPDNVQALKQCNKKRIKREYNEEKQDYDVTIVPVEATIEGAKSENTATTDEQENDDREDISEKYPQTYQLYVNCGEMNKSDIENALKLLKYQYSKNHETNGTIAFVADEDYGTNPTDQKNNPILRHLQQAMKEARYYEVAALFMSTKTKLPKKSKQDKHPAPITTQESPPIVDDQIPTPPPLTPLKRNSLFSSYPNFYSDSPESDSEINSDDDKNEDSNNYNNFITSLLC